MGGEGGGRSVGVGVGGWWVDGWVGCWGVAEGWGGGRWEGGLVDGSVEVKVGAGVSLRVDREVAAY